MTNDQNEVNRLLEKLEFLLKRQNDFSREINNLKTEIHKLRNQKIAEPNKKQETKQNKPVPVTDLKIKKDTISTNYQETASKETPKQTVLPKKKAPKKKI